MNRYDLIKKVWVCAGELIAEKGYVSPVDLLVKMDRLTPQQVEDWRFRRIPYLERAVIGNLSKMNTILLALREFARSAELKPSLTAYMSWGKGPKQRLRFSKYGNPCVEENYYTHYVTKSFGKPRKEIDESDAHGSGVHTETTKNKDKNKDEES
ncbi:MAG: hypothetical protein PHY77_08105 [Desulfotomaculaceae bacterium]|nr:hypothetical protein [Desulfotomaculaceae bacterium]